MGDPTDRPGDLDRFDSREFLRREAIVRNEQAARAVNESTAGDAARGLTSGPEFACECGDAACMERLAISLTDYRATHDTPNRFVVRPGHEILDLERVIEDAGTYRVVEKVFAPA